jgi:hypothetical protein
VKVVSVNEGYWWLMARNLRLDIEMVQQSIQAQQANIAVSNRFEPFANNGECVNEYVCMR